MMTGLKDKALSEKYFKSIRYFSHLLKGEKKVAFLKELSDYNIYLSAQCLMSSERDLELESTLKLKSEILARDFENIEKSAKGFLALAEFESYETILNSITSISTPNKIHQQVFNKIFSESNESVFLKFFEVLIKANKPLLITFLVSAYNKEIIATTENKDTLRKIFNYLIESKLFGLYRVFIEKANLFQELPFILGKGVEEIIAELMRLDTWKVIKLCYFIAASNNILTILTPKYFVESILKYDAKKGLMFAIKICVRHKLYSIPELDRKIISYLIPAPVPKILKKNRNAVNRFIVAGLLNYAHENPDLTNKIKSFISEHNIPERQSDYIEEYNDDTLFLNNEITEFYIGQNNLEDLFNNYLNNSDFQQILRIDDVIRHAVKYYAASLMQISHLLRKYEFNGIVMVKKDYGSYINIDAFSYAKNPFIHASQVYEKDDTKKYEDLSVGDILNVRIIGINKETFRLNLSSLKEFKTT